MTSYLSIGVKNQGCSLELVNLEFMVGDKRYLGIRPPTVELRPRESYEYVQNPLNLASTIRYDAVYGTVNIKAVVTEKAGKEWTTNAIPFDIDDLGEKYRQREKERERLVHEQAAKQEEIRLNRMFPWRRGNTEA